MPADRDDFHQTRLWRLEDDLEGTSQDYETRASGVEAENTIEEPLQQPPGQISFDTEKSMYTYTGYVLEEGQYVQKTWSFTCDEIDVWPSEDASRVCAMVDRVGRDAKRQTEIRRYGKRSWHSPFRPESAAGQGLDYVFRHDVDLVAATYPYVESLYETDPAWADQWTGAMFSAYKAYVRLRDIEPFLKLLREVGIPPDVFGIDADGKGG